MEAYSQTLSTWVGRNAGKWNDREWYNENEYEMEVRKPDQKSQRSDVNYAVDVEHIKTTKQEPVYTCSSL